VNLVSGVVATIFSIVAINLASGDSATTFEIVLTIAISTVLLSYLIIYPSAVRLRRLQPDTQRPFRVPGGSGGMWACTALATGFMALGSWVAVFPGTLESLFGVSYDFEDTWGVSRGHFEALTVGTLVVIGAIAAVGFALGARERRRDAAAITDEGARATAAETV
jgi:amino acid transporter